MTNGVWLQLLDELEEQIPLFVQTFTEEVKARALYDADLVSEEDIWRTADETMRILITHLRGNDSELSSFATALGKRRARQGIPLKPLVEVIRLDLRIIWQMLLRLASPDRVPVLVQYVERVITVLDGYIDDVQHAFLAEVAVLQRDSRLATDHHLSRLFNAAHLSASLLHDIAQGIGIDPACELEVILFKPHTSREEPPREVQRWLSTRQVFSYVYHGWLLLFREPSVELSTWPKEFANTPSIYVHRVSGLATVAAAARAAVDLQSSAPEVVKLTDFEEFWAAGTEEYLDSLVPGFFRAILGGVEKLPLEERDRLTQTVQSFLDSGSIKAASIDMNCHRNTVVNRLRLFHELTGLDVSVPTRAALAVILLARPRTR